MRIAIIGGGITGLSLANLLKEKKEVFLFEADEIGGKIKTQYYLYNNKNYFIELGPDSVIFEEQKIKKIEEFFPNIFDNKNFAKNNPIYIFDGNSIKLLPANFSEFLKTSLLTFDEKFLVFVDFLLELFKLRNYDLNITLREYCDQRISKSFCKKVLEPLFSNIFGLSSDKLIVKFIYPLIKKSFWRYKPVRMFNSKFGMKKWIEKLSNKIKIVKNKIVNIREFEGKFSLKGIDGKEFDNFNKIVITGQAYNIIEIMKNIDFGSYLQEANNLKNQIIYLLSKISFHSSFIDIFILKNFVNLKANGVIFKSFDFIKSLTFFSKKWYDDYDVEIIRVFGNTENFEDIIKDTKKFFSFLSYDFESNILDHFKVKWERALVDYDKDFLENYEKLRKTCKEFEKFGIYIFASFLGGSNITDRIIFSIDNHEIL